MKAHNQHFVERLIARTFSKASDIAINPAIIPDMLPDTFHLPEQQQFIIPFPLSTSSSSTSRSTSSSSSINAESKPSIDSELGTDESKETSAEAKGKEVTRTTTTTNSLVPKKSSTLSPPPPPPHSTETSAEAKSFQDNVSWKININTSVDNDNKNTEPKEEPKRVISFVKKEQSYKQQKPAEKKEIEKKQNVPVSNKNKEQIISAEQMPSDKQVHALTDTNTLNQVNKFSQKRQKIPEEAVYKKTSPPLQPEHMQEYLSLSPTRFTIPAVKSTTEQTQSGLSNVSKRYGSIVAKGKGNQEGSQRYSDHTVTINIGHIEVRAIMPQKSSSPKMQPSSHALSLRDYLKKRSEGRL